MKLKIVIPFYNVETTIKRTVDSIKMQSVDNFDCVLIDDGSIDQTNRILEENINNDARFSVIKNDQNNGSPIENIKLPH